VDNCFVYPDRIIGTDAEDIRYKPLVLGPSNARPTAGRLKGWIRSVAEPAKFSSRLTFAISLSFGALLIKHLGAESGGFHFFSSKSSQGKTLLLLAAQSVHMRADRPDLPHWDTTMTRLEEIAARHCDQALALDEIAHLPGNEQSRAETARMISFKLASGSGRLRSSRYTVKGDDLTWRLFMLSSGETGISELAKAAGKDRLQGDAVRLIDVPAIASKRFGIFERVPEGLATAQPLATLIEEGCREHYGHPAREFVERLVDNLDRNLALVKRWRGKFFERASVPVDSWERRFADRFAVAYAGARLAARLGLVPWKRDWILAATVRCYRGSRHAIPDYEKLIRSSIARVRGALSAGDAVVDLRRRQSNVGSDLAKAEAFLKHDPEHGPYFAVTRKAFASWVGDQVSTTDVLTRLRDVDALLTTSRDIPTRQVLVTGLARKRRYVCIRRSFVERR
jgi:hypothetical protein